MQHGSLEVYYEREFERIVLVRRQSPVSVIEQARHLKDIGGIVFQVVIGHIKVNIHRRRIDTRPRTVRLTLVRHRFAEYQLSRRTVLYGNVHRLCAAQKSRVNRIDSVYRTARFSRILIGKRNVLSVCGNLRRGRILRERICAEIHDIILICSAQRTGCVCVGKRFIQRVEGIVQLVFIRFEVIEIEQRRLRPIPVEREVRNVEIDFRSVFRFQRNKAFYVHPVFERLIEISFVGIAQRDFHGDFRGLVAFHRHFRSVCRSARYRRNGHRRAVEKISFFGYDRKTFRGKRIAHAFRHHDRSYVVGKFCALHVHDIERHGINAGLRRIVSEFQLRFIRQIAFFVVSLQISGRRSRFVQVDESRALLAYGIGKSVFVIYDIRRGHHNTVNKFCRLFRRKILAGKLFLHILINERRNPHLVGRSHRRSGKAVVALPGHSRINFAAVRRNFGFNA